MPDYRLPLSSLPASDFELQDSALLTLPAELRNSVYEYACSHIEQAIILPGSEPQILATGLPLSQACRQLRYEVTPVYRAHALQNAGKLVCPIKNFDCIDNDRVMTTFLEKLPPLPDGTTRKFIQKLFLDNTFDQGTRSIVTKANSLPFPAFNHYLWPTTPQSPKCYTVVRFDSRSFDVEYLRSFMHRYLSPDVYGGSQLYEAMIKAIQRHDRAQERLKRSKARVRMEQARAREKRKGSSKPSGKREGRVKNKRLIRAQERSVPTALPMHECK